MSENISRYNKKAKPIENNPLADIVVQFVVPYKENYAGLVGLLEKLLLINNLNFEIFVVDDNSDNEKFFTDILKLPGVTGHRFTEDKGFGYCVNFAVHQSPRNIIIVLHSDVSDFETRTFKNLVLSLIAGKEDNVAMVSSVVDNPMPADCRIIKAANSVNQNYKLIEKKEFVPMISVALSKSVFVKVGGLPNYEYCWFEDRLFCKKLQSQGYNIAIAPSSLVRHLGGQSIKRLLDKNPKLIQTIKANYKRYEVDSQKFDLILSTKS